MRGIQLIRAKPKVGPTALHAAIVVLAGGLLGSCAFVDAHTPRIYQNNLTFQDANSQEALLNIVRASRYEALSFVQIGQETGTQTETLNNGLPSFTFGPAQVAASKQFVFGGNSLSSAATGGFQVTPMNTSGFMQGMLTPITPKTLALLIGTFPREWVYYAVIGGIKLTGTNTATHEHVAYYLRNDPADDQYGGAPAIDKCRALANDYRDNGLGTPFYSDDSVCNFSKFSYALGLAVDFGLTSEIIIPAAKGTGAPAPAPKSPKGAAGAGSPPAAPQATVASATGGTNSPGTPQTPPSPSNGNATATPDSIGHLCWDPVLALSQYRNAILGSGMTNVCGRPLQASPKFGFHFRNADFDSIEFVFRSSYGVYKYLGQLLREQSAGRIQLHNLRTLEERELSSGPFINIAQEASSDCLVTAFYTGQSYCVPRKGSNSTATLLDLLGQLKNLSTSSSDVNAAFAVRLVD